MADHSIEQLLDAHAKADPQTQRNIAEMILDKVEGRREIWMTDHQALSNVLIALGTERALEAARGGNKDLIDTFGAHLDEEPVAFLEYNLSKALMQLGELQGNSMKLQAAIAAAERSATYFCRCGLKINAAHAIFLAAAGNSTYGDQTRSVISLRLSVEQFDSALETVTSSAMPVDWAAIQNNRALALQRLGELAGDTAALSAAATGFTAVLEVVTRGAMPADWATTQNNKAAALQSLGELAGDAVVLREAVAGYDAALEVRTYNAMPTDWATTLAKKSLVLKSLGDLAGDAAVLREAVSSYEAVLEIVTREFRPHDWEIIQANRAAALHSLGELAGDAAILREALEGYDAALEVRTRNAMPSAWAMTQNNRATVLQSLGDLVGDGAVLREAVAGYDAALKVRTCDAAPTDWANTKSNRAVAQQRLGELVRDGAVLREAVAGYDAALKVRTRDATPADWANTQNNRATALQSLGDLAGDAVVLREAVAGFDAALAVWLRDTMPANWATAQDNRATALKSLGLIVGDAAVLREAVAGYNAALEIRFCNAMPAAWAMTQINKATVLHSLGELVGDAAVLREAVAGYDAALKILIRDTMPTAWTIAQINRAIALQRLGNLTGDAFSLSATTAGFNAAWRQLQKSGAEHTMLLLGAYISRQPLAQSDLSAALTYINPCLGISDAAIADAPRSADGKLEAVHQVSDLHGMKAVCVLRTGDPGDETVWQAALAAEAGRARLARDAISAEVPEGVTTPEALAAGAPEGGALILPVITASESLAFVIRPDGPPEVVELPGLTSDTLQARFNGEDGWIAAQGAVAAAGRGFQRGVPAYTDWNAHLDAQAAWLHAHLLAPLEDRLASLGLRPSGGDYPGDPVVLLPTGLLGLLPLGAARAAPDDPAFAERWSLTLAPSAAMLAACRSRAAERDARPCQLLGLFDPSGDLPGASREAEFVSAHLNGLSDDRMRLLRGRDATRDAALAGAGNVSHLLLSCHGVHDAIVPERSGLQLFDDRPREPLNPMPPGRLALGDLRDLRLKARLVQMSACESGVAGVRKAPDEFVGLPAGVLAAGAAAAIGTLWSVNDDTTATFSTRFLAAHLNSDGTQRMAPAEAFHETQRWLRNVTVDELKSNQAWYWPGSAALKGSAVRQTTVSNRDLGGSTLETLIGQHSGSDRPFKNPHDWAAFTYTGA